MIVQLYKPRPELQHFISRIMVSSFQLDAAQPTPTCPFPPQPEHCLYFYPRDKMMFHNYASQQLHALPQSLIVGPQLSRYDLTMGYNMLVIMVGFKPGALHRLLHIPMNEILNTPVDAAHLLGKEVEGIIEQLNEAQNPEKMVKVVQLYLLNKISNLKSALPMEEALTQMLLHKGLINVDLLAKQAYVSVRQLERQFYERIGMCPKMYLKLVRFSKAWIMRERIADISWLEIAHTCGYADQMHMIRDFKYFAGVTPRILENDLEQTSLRLQASTFI